MPLTTSEHEVKEGILLEYGMRPDILLFINPVGMAFYKGGARVPYGLIKGASDLIGWFIVFGVAVFLAVELKRPKKGKTSEPQFVFIENVRKAGGCAGIVLSVAGLQLLLDEYVECRKSGHGLQWHDRTRFVYE